MKQVSDGLGNEQGLVVVDRRWSQKPHLAVQPRLQVWVPLLRRENKSRTILYKGSVSIARPASFDLYVILKSSNPMKVKLPPYITLAAGKTNAMFSIRVSSLGSTKGSVVIKGEASGYVSSSAKLSFPKRRRLVVRKVPHKSGNLIVNGDFERGDRGFSSTYRVSSQGVREGVYYVGSSSKAWNYYFSYNVKDHTTGSGLMLLGNGKSKSTPVWEQAVKIKKGETYQFSGWTSSLSKTVHAKLEFSVGGEVVKTVVLKKRWEPFSAQWKSPLSGIVVLSIRDLNTESIGNDFALDDLYFGPSTSAKGGLILHYTFDSDSGRVVVDRSGHGNDGRLMNRCSYVDGVQGKGLKIFGDNQTYGGHGGHVKLPTLDFNSMEGVTIALWVKEVQMHHPHGEAYISFGSINLGNDENILSIQHFHNQMEFVGGTTTLSKPFDLSGRGRFVHYALTYSDGQLCAYRDGVLVQKKAGKLLVDEPSLAALGRHWWTSASHSSTRLTAVFDEVRIYSRALSEREIRSLASKTDSSLIASYPFNGSADDISGNGYHGVVHGATLTTDRFGNPNSAYYFDGKNDYIRLPSIPNVPALEDYTLSVWFMNDGKGTQGNYGQKIIDKTAYFHDFYISVLRDGRVRFMLYEKLPAAIGSDSHNYCDGAWHHVLIRKKGTFASMWLDGVCVDSCNNAKSVVNSSSFLIGYSDSSDSLQKRFWSGKIDDLRMYNRALTHAEINALAQKPDSSLMASYPFNGSADDVSGNGHNGVVHGATLTTDRFGNPNSAYRFDGEDDYISIPDHPDFTVTDATVCAWIRTSDRSNEKHITSCYGRNTSSEWYHLYIDSESGAGCWQVDPGGPKIPPRVVGTRMIADGEWHFLVGVRDTSSKHLKIYVDGVLQSTVLDHSTKPLDPEVDFWIGGQNGFPQRFFHGEIDDVSVYKRALSSEEILNMYNDDKGLELIAHYSFDGNANDDSGNGHKGIVHGVTLTTDRLGKRNGAYRFDGENDYIRVSDAEALRLSNSDFSIGIWFKEYARNDSYQSVLLAKRGSGSNDGWIFSTQGNKRDSRAGRLYYQVSGGLAPWHQSNQSLELNEWHYAVLTYKKAQQELRVYVDGVLDSVCSDMPAPFAEGNSALLIGRDSSSSSYYFNGVIDDIAIYKGILPKSKIVKEYAGQGLMAYFPFDGNANDDSGNGHNGTVYNARLTADRFGHPNRAYYFDGNSSFIDCGNIITNAAQFTVSAWVRVDRFTDPHYMGPWSQQSFSVPRANCNYHMYTGNSGNNCFGISMAWADGADCTVRSGHILPLGEWRLVTQTYDGTFYRLYDNGNLVTKKRMLNHRLISKERFLIGKTCAYPNYIEKPVHFAGMIDDLRIYNRALNAREIKHLLTPKSNVNVDVEISVESFQPTNQQFQIFSGSPKSPVKPEIRLNTIIIEVNKYGEVTLGNTTYSKQNSLADLVQKLKEKKEESQRAGKTICVKALKKEVNIHNKSR